MNDSEARILAVAYRNVDAQPIGPACDADADGRENLDRENRRVRQRRQRHAAELLLGDLLERVTGGPSTQLTLIRNFHDKPILVTGDTPNAIDVSLSHSGFVVLAAISDLGKIGADVEFRAQKRSISEIAAYAFGPQEQQAIESGGRLAFYRIWTLREALAKASGIGFPILADRRDYFSQAPTSGSWQTSIDGRRWLFSTGDLQGDYAVSVAIALEAPLPVDYSAALIPRELD